MTDIKEVIRFVRYADDDDLAILAPLIARRRVELQNDRMFALQKALKPGDIVQIRDNIKPKYMAKRRGVFRSYAGTRALIELESPTKRFGKSLRVPLVCLDKVDG